MERFEDSAGKVWGAVDMDKLVVGIAEGKVACADQLLVSYALGSCVGICLYDARSKIAGMAHIILPEARYAARKDNPYKFAPEGIRALLEEMKSYGAVYGSITAKIAGGARMFGGNGSRWPVGDWNVEAVERVLEERGIPLLARDTGGTYGRTILFYAEDGRLEINTVRHVPLII